MNRINLIIDYYPKNNTYSITMIGESEKWLCTSENLTDITKKILTPKIIFTESAKKILAPT